MPQISTDIDTILASVKRRVEKIVPEPEFRAKLEKAAKTQTPLRLKLGMDPTAPDVHLGHAVPLKVLRTLQDAGHKAVLIIGDYTARVGDPSGRNTTRPVLSGEEIDANAKTYIAQVGKVLLTDPDHLEIRFNGEWLGKMTMVDIIKLASRKTVSQLLAREDFAKRYAEGTPISLHELMYPLLQGWDSVMINADVEFGGSDQLFNNLVGRELQQDMSEKKEDATGQAVIVTPLLVGTDGTMKMSKSKNNYIGLIDPAGGDNGIYWKIQRIPDALLANYYTLLTDIPEAEFTAAIAADPRAAKDKLADHLIAWLHPEAAAAGGYKTSVNELQIGPGPHPMPALLVKAGFVKSNSEAIRKIREGAVKVDDQKWPDKQDLTVDTPKLLTMGKANKLRLLP